MINETTDKTMNNIESSHGILKPTRDSQRIRKNIFKGEDISEELHYRAEYVSKLPKESTDWRDLLKLLFCCQIKRALKYYRESKRVSSLGISEKELLERYVQVE